MTERGKERERAHWQQQASTKQPPAQLSLSHSLSLTHTPCLSLTNSMRNASQVNVVATDSTLRRVELGLGLNKLECCASTQQSLQWPKLRLELSRAARLNPAELEPSLVAKYYSSRLEVHFYVYACLAF